MPDRNGFSSSLPIFSAEHRHATIWDVWPHWYSMINVYSKCSRTIRQCWRSMMSKNDDFQRQISAAIIQLRLRSPFFATLALFARILPSQNYPTAATDGRDIFINPQFWRGLTSAERLGLLAHEVLHAALLHVPR